jgi:L-serine dehydratase
VLLGLEGETADAVDVDGIVATLERIRTAGRLRLLGRHEIAFDEALNLLFHRDQILPRHSNGMRFSALAASEQLIRREDYYSIGGGFIVRGDEPEQAAGGADVVLPHPFESAQDLLRRADEAGLSIHALMLENECAWRSEADVRAGLLRIWEVMKECVRRGLARDGVLPGGLKVTRRAPKLYRNLISPDAPAQADVMDWVNAFALAVNEENAAGGRVVTAPTNGAAGIVPAVLHYYRRFASGADQQGVLRFLLTAGAIGILYKKNASISGAEMGCQGEVGVACSMAAGGLMAALGGLNWQIENAAEIGMEHNLGLTCDPIAGLVQIPCIERNAMGAVKAINAARMAVHGDGTHKVTLDQVIATMRQTGRDMSHIYKETSLGGLAVNVPEC